MKTLNRATKENAARATEIVTSHFGGHLTSLFTHIPREAHYKLIEQALISLTRAQLDVVCEQSAQVCGGVSPCSHLYVATSLAKVLTGKGKMFRENLHAFLVGLELPPEPLEEFLAQALKQIPAK